MPRKRPKPGRPTPARPTLRDVPFSQLVDCDPDLAAARREHAAKPAATRRRAADWHYHQAGAAQLVGDALGGWGGDEEPWPGEALALAIDPTYAPAIVTIGSYEYIYGRPDAALALFLSLVDLPPDTEDLPEIIDKAGDFLLDAEDCERALRLYQAAVRSHPDVALYHTGAGYCEGKLGRVDEELAHGRRAVELEPDNGVWLSNLGWFLTLAGRFDEAEPILERAVALVPKDDHLAQGNLKELRRLRKAAGLGTAAGKPG